jgi:hypothetical protein
MIRKAPVSETKKEAQALPAPTGMFAVGTTLYHLIDSARQEVHVQDSHDTRELMLQIWYPAGRVKTRPVEAIPEKAASGKAVEHWYINPSTLW